MADKFGHDGRGNYHGVSLVENLTENQIQFSDILNINSELDVAKINIPEYSKKFLASISGAEAKDYLGIPQDLEPIPGPPGIEGPPGPKGDGVSVGHTYSSHQDLLNDEANIPDNAFIFINSGTGNPNNGEFYTKTAGELILNGVLEGIEGPAGQRGPQGPDGVKGVAGQRGIQGPPGPAGTNATPYTLPSATSNVLGGVKIGNGLTIVDGVISIIEKAYLNVSHLTDIAIPVGDKVIVGTTVVRQSGIPYNSTTGLFTLKANKNYRITFTAKISGGTHQIEVRARTAANGNINNIFMKSAGGTSERSSNTYDVMYKPTVDTTVKMQTLGVTATGAKIDKYTMSLVVQEV